MIIDFKRRLFRKTASFYLVLLEELWYTGFTNFLGGVCLGI